MLRRMHTSMNGPKNGLILEGFVLNDEGKE